MRKQIQKEEKGKKKEEKKEESLIRILATDIPGNKKVYSGLTKIKGVGWSFSNIICRSLGIDKNRKISDLSENEIKKIEGFVKNPKILSFAMNRRKDFDTGEDRHLSGADIDLQKGFDIRRLRKIKSYRGIRHILGQPVRGQRTKSHFRKGRAIGVKKGKVRRSGK